MRRELVINENAGNAKITGINYFAEKPTDMWLICYHGIGERGPMDGSALSKVEVHGYPKHMKNGLELPFNVFAAQTPVTNYNTYNKVIAAHIKLKYGASVIGQTGLSMGGIGTWNMLWEDQYKLLKFIVPVCGATSGRPFEHARNIPVLAVHGDKDTTAPVQYYRGKATVDNLNAVNPGQAELITLPGVAHNAWDQAYDVKGPVGKEVLTFITMMFVAEDKEYELGYADCKKRALSMLTGL